MSPTSMQVSAYCKHAFSPILYFTRIFGLLPFTFTQQGPKYSIVFSRLWAIYGILLGTIVVTLILGGTALDLIHNDPSTTMDLLRIIRFIDIALSTACILTSVTMIVLRRNQFLQLMHNLTQIDLILHHQLNDLTKPKRYAICLIALVWGYSGVLITYDRSVLPGSLYFLPYICSYLIMITIGAQYWLITDGFTRRVGALRTCLTLNHVVITSVTLSKNDEMAKLKNKPTNKPTNKIDNYDKLLFVPSRRILSAEYVADMILVFGNLWDAMTLFNYTFGPSVLGFISYVVINLTVSPYYLYSEIEEGKHFEFILLDVMWFCFHIGRLIMIVEPAHRLNEELEALKPLVCKLLTLDVDKSTRKQLKTLSVYVIHSSITFRPCGMFNINRNVLITVIGTVTTYFVIVINFHRDNNK